MVFFYSLIPKIDGDMCNISWFQLKLICVPQYSLHYRFNCDTFFPLVCFLKRKNKCLKCRIPSGNTKGSFRDAPNSIFSVC